MCYNKKCEAIILKNVIKHRQHYVFQAYLQNWSENNQIWCCRNKQKCFRTNTINIAQERDFYKIKELNTDEEKFIMLFLNKQPTNNIEIMRRQMETYEKPLSWQKTVNSIVTIIKTKIYKDRPIPRKVEDLLNSIIEVSKSAINDMVEELYCDDESELIKMINLLEMNNLDFYYNPYSCSDVFFENSRLAFLYYLCSQHYRTKAARVRLAKGLSNLLENNNLSKFNINKNNICPENLVHHIFWYIECILSDKLYNKNAHLTLLLNHTNIPFLASDQPIINILADYQSFTDEVSDLIFYYPISPKIAITVNDKNNFERYELNESEVELFNQKLIAASYEYVFSNSEECLTKYFSLPREESNINAT